MGCSKCKKKNKEKTQNVEFTEIDGDNDNKDSVDNLSKSVSSQFNGQSFTIKLATFLVLVAGFPIIYVGIIIMLFVQFFRDGKGQLHNPLQALINWSVKVYGNYRIRKEVRKREKQFEKNRSYEGDSELLNVEVFQTEENNVVDEE
jgi:hypothetical protein